MYSSIHHSVNSGRVIASSFSAFRTISFPTVPFHPIPSICGIIPSSTINPNNIYGTYCTSTCNTCILSPLSYPQDSAAARHVAQLHKLPSKSEGVIFRTNLNERGETAVIFPSKKPSATILEVSLKSFTPVPGLALPCLALPYPVQGEGGNGKATLIRFALCLNLIYPQPLSPPSPPPPPRKKY